MRCPECARQKTQVVKTGGAVNQPTLTYVLIGINVAVALGGILSGGSAGGGGGFGSSDLLRDGSVSRFTIDEGEYWRLLTSGFLHVGFLHLAFNMFALYVLGDLLEPAVGRLRFALIYFASLFAGSFGALLLEPNDPTVGASGAVFGLMGAAFVVMRSRGMNPMESGLGLWIGLNLLITFTIPNISIGGHIGGLIGGALAALALVDMRERVRVPEAVPALLVVLIAVSSVVGAIAVSASG
jgi:membrane associated rhomboid family serine protease